MPSTNAAAAPLNRAVVSTRVRIPYRPRVEQSEFHDDAARFKVLVAHRRLGKTVAAVNEAIKATVRCRHAEARGAYIAPFRNQAKRVAWGYAKGFTRNIPGIKYENAELGVLFPNGARFDLFGGDNVHALRGVYLDHTVIDEPSQMHPLLWPQVLRPALSDRRGSGTFIGTPQGKNAFWKLYADAATLPGWSRFLFKVSDTRIIDADELVALRREMDEDSYNQEYECDFDAAIKGAYFGKAMREAMAAGHILALDYDPALPVHTSHDLGTRDYMVTLYWQVSPAGQIRCIDADGFIGGRLDDVVRKLREKPYLYSGEHALPHDVKVRELGGGSRFEQLWELGLRGQVVQSVSHMDGVQAMRRMFPRVYWDDQRGECPTLLEALRQYRAEYDERQAVLSESPLKDWTWDYADAVRYFALHPAAGNGRSFHRATPQLMLQLNAELERAAV